MRTTKLLCVLVLTISVGCAGGWATFGEMVKTNASLKVGPIEVGAEVVPDPAIHVSLGLCGFVRGLEWTHDFCGPPPPQTSE